MPYWPARKRQDEPALPWCIRWLPELSLRVPPGGDIDTEEIDHEYEELIRSERAEAKITEVKNLHSPVRYGPHKLICCGHCKIDWPCQTIQILEG